ncbi:unnamed protein product [Orchesella dallaii]|uniref:Anaphase-promoting complex subunit CDC26 n=1 Tax=Orchesella dallaii TaxID=48710 RepID=A0ABP1QBT3_9HEXA
MIRRSPTRIELKLEDLADFDYIQKFEKKKAPNSVPGAVGGISAADAQKFIRQDRIGFRPIRTGATSTGSGGGTGNFYPSGANSAAAIDVISGVMTAEASTSTVEAQGGESGTPGGITSGTNRSVGNIADMDVSGDDGDGEMATPSNITAESNVSNVDMSLDDSL